MNTLPENKEYILGCQCDFCIDYKYKKKFNHLININSISGKEIYYIDEEIFVKKILKMDDIKWYNINYWNQFENEYCIPIFNPLYEKWKNNFFKKKNFKNYQKQI